MFEQHQQFLRNRRFPAFFDVIKLTLVTNKNDQPLQPYLDFVARCAQSGITAVQLREKKLSYEEAFIFGKQLQTILKPFSVSLIINDSLELADDLNSDGVHLGQLDGSVVEARRKLGKNKIIGLTVNSIEEMLIANNLPIDYVGIGAIYPTNSKKDVKTILGCEGLKKIAQISKHPIIAIGGIDEVNALAVMRAGAAGIAAIAAFHDTLDPIVTTKNLRDVIENIKND